MTTLYMRSFRLVGLAACATAVTIAGFHAAAELRLARLKGSFQAEAAASRPAERDPIWRLGNMLFHDAALSKSGRTACATCHQLEHGWSNSQARAIGDSGRSLAFKAPTLIDAGSLSLLGWTGNFSQISTVTIVALTSPNNMGSSLEKVTDVVRNDPQKLSAFKAAFRDDWVDESRILNALSVYVSSIKTDTPFDRWIAGDQAAIDGQAQRGFTIFTGKGMCVRCHYGPSLSDGSFEDIGTSNDEGRGTLFPNSVKLKHAFKTPSLRGVADRAPYMHDGSLKGLEDVIDLYNRGGVDRTSRDDDIHPLHLTEGEKADLISFLRTLSGPTYFVLKQ